MTASRSEPVLPDLAPCPFCGVVAVVGYVAVSLGDYAVRCLNATCGVKPEAYGRTPTEAIARWNARRVEPSAAPEPTQTLTDRLEFVWRTMPAAAKAANGSFVNWMLGLDAAIAATPEFRGKPLDTEKKS